jgi:hypothetical protein
MWIFGIILIAVGIGLFFYKKKLEDKLLNVKYFDQSNIKSVLDTCLSVSKELGSGHFSQMVKINAKARIEEPLTAEFSKEKCVYFQASAEHEYETLVETKNDQGRISRNWIPGSESIGSVEEGGLFYIQDASGQVDIDIQGSDLTIKQSHKQFKSSSRPKDFSFGYYNPRSDRDFKSKGYSEVEKNIPIGTNLFIIGELHDRNGSPMIGLPKEKENPFIVSIHSEEKVIGGLESKTKSTYIGALVCLGLGAGLTIFGLIKAFM